MVEDGFFALRDCAVALAEAGDFPAAADLFRRALQSPEAQAAHQAATAVPSAIGGHISAAASSRSHTVGAAPLAPRLPDLAAVHDMLCQCLMELACGAAEERQRQQQERQQRPRGPGTAVHHCEAPSLERALEEEAEAAPGGQQAGGLGAADGVDEAEAEAQLWQEAMSHAAEATSLRPQWPAGLLTYARCARNCGLLDEALRALRGAEKLLRHRGGPPGVPGAAPTTLAERSQHGCGGGGVPQQCRHQPHMGQGSPTSPLMDDRDPNLDSDSHPSEGPGPHSDAVESDPELESEVSAELAEVEELWQRRLARDVGLPALRLRQDAGAEGGGPGRRVWECGVLLAALLVQRTAAVRAAAGGDGRREHRCPSHQELAGWPSVGPASGAAAASHSVSGDEALTSAGTAGARVLELGCGSALVGIAAAACGARCVSTDLPARLPDAAAAAAANAELLRSGGGWLAVRPLDWAQHQGGDAGAAAAWLLHGMGPWAESPAEEVSGRAALRPCDGAPLAPGLPGLGPADFVDANRRGSGSGIGEGDGRTGCGAASASSRAATTCSWVLGADLVYSAAQVEPLVGLLSALRGAAAAAVAAAAAGPGAGAVQTAPRAGLSGMGASAAAGSAQRAQVDVKVSERLPDAGCGTPLDGAVPWRVHACPPPCRLLLAHKHRSEAVSSLLFGRLVAAAGIQLQRVCPDGDGAAVDGDRLRLRQLAERMPAVELYEGVMW